MVDSYIYNGRLTESRVYIVYWMASFLMTIDAIIRRLISLMLLEGPIVWRGVMFFLSTD